MAKSGYTAYFGCDTKAFEQGMRKVRREANAAFGNIERGARGAAYSFGLAAATGAVMTKSVLNAAATMQDLEGSFRAVTSSAAEANKQLDYVVEFTKTTKFELKDVAEAGLKLQGLGFTASEALEPIAKLAAGMNKDLPDAAAIVGKALLGSRRSITQLRDSYGITTAALQEFGAAVDDNGLILVKGQNNLDKLRTAFERLVEKRYGRIFQEQANNISVVLSNLGDSFFQALAKVGKGASPYILDIARSLTKLTDEIGKLDPAVFRTAGLATLMGTAFTGLVAGGAALIAVITGVAKQYRILAGALGLSESATIKYIMSGKNAGTAISEGFTAARAGVAAFSAETAFGIRNLAMLAETMATGAVPAAMTLDGYLAAMALGAKALAANLVLVEMGLRAFEKYVGAEGLNIVPSIDPRENAKRALDGLIHGQDKLTQLREEGRVKELNNQAKILQSYIRVKDILGLTADEAKKKGYTEIDAANAALALDKLREDATKAGNKQLAETYQLQLAYLQNLIPQLVGAEKAKNDEAVRSGKAAVAAANDASEAYQDFADNRKDQIYETKTQELKALDEVISKTRVALEMVKGKDTTRTNELTGQLEKLSEERVATARKARDEQASLEDEHIRRLLQGHQITKTNAAAMYTELAKKYKQSQTLQEKFSAKSEELKRENIKDTLEASIQVADAEADLADQRRLATEKQIKLGKDVNANIQKGLAFSKEQLKFDLEKIKLEKDKEVADTADPALKKVAIMKAERETAAAIERHQERSNNLKQLGVNFTKDLLQAESELLKSTLAVRDANVEKYETQLNQGKNVGEQLKKEVQAKQKAAGDLLNIEKKLALQGKTDPKIRKDIEKEYDNKKKIEKINNAKELDKIDATISQQQSERRAKLIEINKKEADLRKASIEEAKARGEDVRSQEIRLAEDLFNLEVAKIQSQAEADKKQKDVTTQTLIQRDAELQISILKKGLKKDIDEINNSYKKGTDELDKQKQSLKEINDELAKLKGEEKARQDKQGGLIGGVEDLVAQNERESKIFQLESEKRRIEGDISDKEKSKQGADLNRQEGERFGILRGGRNPAEQQADLEREAIVDKRRREKEQEAEARRQQGRARAEEVLRAKGTSEEDIKKILGINFDSNPTKANTLDQKTLDEYANAGAKGDSPEVVNILTALYNLASRAFGGGQTTTPVQGTKPQNQLNYKGKSDLSTTNPYTGSSDGPYPR